MVRGLSVFQDHFNDFNDQFVLIGGTACELNMRKNGLDFRATKDLDMVLYVEALTDKFSPRFWEFIKKGEYDNRLKSSGKKIYYRFTDPKNKMFPEILELFSRDKQIDENIEIKLGPMPLSDEIASLSAIMMDEEYYSFISDSQSRIEIEGIPVLVPEYLIPLKARAYLDLSEKKANGESIDSADIKKHRNDILRLYNLLSNDTRISLAPRLKKDFMRFIIHLSSANTELKSFGIISDNKNEVINNLRAYFLQE